MTFTHGTSAYRNHGCRCPICTEGCAASTRQYRDRLKSRTEAAS